MLCNSGRTIGHARGASYSRGRGIFRDFGPAWREANRGHLSHAQLKVMSAIEACRTAALGGYVARCENDECDHTVIAYCSCRNRHCPKCQGSQARAWMEERKAELLEVPYFHIVFTLPAEIGAIASRTRPSSMAFCSRPPPTPC
jgi:hypothetical protein